MPKAADGLFALATALNRVAEAIEASRPSRRKAGAQPTRSRRYTAEQDAIIRQDYAAHLPLCEIADKLGRPLQGVRQRIRTLGLRRARSGASWFTPKRRASIALRVSSWSPEETALVRRDFAAGVPIAEIAAKLGRPKKSVSNKIYSRLKLHRGRSGGSYTSEQIATIQQDFAAGVPVREIAEKLGRPFNSVQGKVYSLGLCRPRRSKEPAADEPVSPSPDFPPPLNKPVSEIELPARARNAFKEWNITFVGELVQLTGAEMLRIPNFGSKSLKEVEKALANLGLELGLELSSHARTHTHIP